MKYLEIDCKLQFTPAFVTEENLSNCLPNIFQSKKKSSELLIDIPSISHIDVDERKSLFRFKTSPSSSSVNSCSMTIITPNKTLNLMLTNSEDAINVKNALRAILDQNGIFMV